MIFKRNLCLSLCLSVFLFAFVAGVNAQTRSRVVGNPESRPTNTQTPLPTVKKTVLSSPTTPATTRPSLTNQIVVVGQTRTVQPQNVPLVKSTASVSPANSMLNSRLVYTSDTNTRMLSAIKNKLGIPYLYGSNGPNRYDCSSFVWKVFQDAGIYFTRTSARTFWNQFEPVYGDDRFQFGTLVFFNKLGHVGIVADKEGFYQASSSKGITYSKFAGYWEKRIVGYRRVPAAYGMN